MNDFFSFWIKVAWLVMLMFFPPVATIFYFLVGRDQRVTHYKAGKTVTWIILLVPVISIIVLYLLFHGTFDVQNNVPEVIRI